MPGMMSIGGLASGIKTDEVVAKIMEYARRPQNQLLADKALAQTRLAAWQDLNTRVLALRTRANAIADAADFGLMQVVSSDESIVTASASADAAPGSYFIKVTSRAQSHQVASQSGSYTSVNDIVGTGTVEIALADGTDFSVTLDSNNNTLSGLRDAINKANKGVKAAIVNTGSSENPNYRMVLTSTNTGLAKRMTSVDTSGLSGGVAPTFDLENPVQAASDAVVEMGEGLGKITVSKSSNSVTELIPGVTLNIAGYDAGKTVKIDVTRNTQAIKTAIEGFVQQYNDLSDAIGNHFKYDGQSGESGPLMGDYQLQSIQMDLESTVTGMVAGLDGKYAALSQIGITLDQGGHLTIDDSQLSRALEEHPEDVTRVFDAHLESGSSYVSFVTSTSDTKPSGSTGWQVDVTQVARRAQVTAGVEFLGPLTSTEVLTVNGKSITLEEGWDIDRAITEINKYSSETNVMALKTGADGTEEGNYLTLRRVQYGSNYSFTVVSDKSLSAGTTSGFGNVTVEPKSDKWAGESGAGQGMAGLDVAGTINGEAATGKGLILSLDSTTSKNAAKGLAVRIAENAPLGQAKVVFTKGVGASLRDTLTQMTSFTGIFSTAQNGINELISDLDNSIASMESRLADQELRLYTQFTTMESQLAKLQQQGNYLVSQFAAMNKK